MTHVIARYYTLAAAAARRRRRGGSQVAPLDCARARERAAMASCGCSRSRSRPRPLACERNWLKTSSLSRIARPPDDVDFCVINEREIAAAALPCANSNTPLARRTLFVVIVEASHTAARARTRFKVAEAPNGGGRASGRASGRTRARARKGCKYGARGRRLRRRRR